MKFNQEIDDIYKGVEYFLNNLRKPNNKYSYLPALKGLTEEGKNLSLGFSCYALKINFMLGKVSKNSDEINNWANYLNSFQKNEKEFPKNSYIDPFLKDSYENTDAKLFLKESVKAILNILYYPSNSKKYERRKDKFKKTINAETKQAISTLYEINLPNKNLIENQFENFEHLEIYLNSLDWSAPWDAGAQYSSFCVYSVTQNFNINEKLLNYINKKVDIKTGSYFDKKPASSRQIINGAMKVITGLDWLKEEIHYPENLIDYCIQNRPILEGCDIVDYVYTLYMCSQQVDYKKKEVNKILNEILLDLINLRYKDEGGFSYFQDKSQSHYYGIKITHSLKTPDLHGTLLCLWALNMILDNLGELDNDKQIIKP